MTFEFGHEELKDFKTQGLCKKKNYSQKIRVMSFLRGTVPDLIVQMRKLRQRFSNLPKIS